MSPDPSASVRRGERGVALAVLLTGLVAAAVLAAVLLPWGPVPGGAPPPVAAAEWFTADELARAEAHARASRAWGWSSLALSTAVLLLLGLTRLGSRLVRRLPGPNWLRVLLAVAAVLVGVRLVTLPLAVGQWQLQREAGLSTQSWVGYARDLVVSEALSVVVTGLGVLLVVAVARRLPRAWPAVAGALLAAFVALGSFVYPVLVEPLFHEFEPLAEGPLRASVLGLADREGVAVEEVLVADASRRTTTLNAYVSGYGDTRRVVVYDTTIEALPEGQLLAIVAHELAHARHDDVLVGTAIGAAAAFAAAGALGLLMPTGAGGGVRRPEAVPRMLMLLAVGSLLAAPLQNAASRLVETRADVDALTATQDPRSFRQMQVRLARRSLADPTPPTWSYWWFASHPTVLERLALATEPGGRVAPVGLSEPTAAAPS